VIRSRHAGRQRFVSHRRKKDFNRCALAAKLKSLEYFSEKRSRIIKCRSLASPEEMRYLPHKAGLKPMQPMQLHGVPRSGVSVDCSFFQMLLALENSVETAYKFHC